MNVFSFDVRQMLRDGQARNLKPGDAVPLRVIRNLENGLYLMSLRGQTVQAKLPDGIRPGVYPATITADGQNIEIDLANPRSLAGKDIPKPDQPLPDKTTLQTNKPAPAPAPGAAPRAVQADAATLGLKAGATTTIDLVSVGTDGAAKVLVNGQTATVRLTMNVPPGQYQATVASVGDDSVEMMIQPRQAGKPPVILTIPKAALPPGQAMQPGQQLAISVERSDDAAATVRIRIAGSEATVSARPAVIPGQQLSATALKAGDIPTLSVDRVLADPRNTEQTARIISGQPPNMQTGNQVSVQVVRPVEGNLFLISLRGRLMQAMFDEFPSLGKYTATVSKKDGQLTLTMPSKPDQPVNPGMLKKELGELNMARIKDAVTKLGSLKLDDFSPEAVKKVVRDGGMHFEHKLLAGSEQGSDGKMQAYQQGDTAGREGITRMQIANFVLAGDLFTFFAGPDDSAKEGTLRISRDAGGNHIVYLKMEFSNIGSTITTIRPVGQTGYDILIKSETDISDRITDIPIENAHIRWGKLEKSDEKPFDIRGEVIGKLGNFEVIV